MSRSDRPEAPHETDLRRWHLEVNEGQQVWRFDAAGQRVQTVVDRYFLGLPTAPEIPETPAAKTAAEATRKGIEFYQAVQTEDGHWAHDYGGPMFLLPGLVITTYITGAELKPEQKLEIKRYLRNRANDDGGWGLHIEGKSTIFGTAMNYVAYRLIGGEVDDPTAAKARQFLLANEGARGIPQWGKLWLAVLGVYSWDGLNSIAPELWMLPYWLPIHPGRWWCHCRVVYLPMGYLYGRRAVAKETALIRQLRRELYCEPYESIDWVSCRDLISPLDKYIDRHWITYPLFAILNAYEKRHSAWVRRKALDLAIDHIRSEDNNTNHIDIGPVNKTLNMLSIWFEEGSDSANFKKHVARIDDYLWLAADGMKMQGYNGSQLWDTAFSVQAIIATGLSWEYQACLKKAYGFIDGAQVRENVPDMAKYYRHISNGAWPFSTRAHGWPIADCTGEGLLAALQLASFNFCRPLPEQRYFDAVNVVLSLQNADGGWATYEQKRGPEWLELLNPAQVFSDIMIDWSYVELSASAICGLTSFRALFPAHRAAEINTAVSRGMQFIKSYQRPDGSWYGSWGVCFLYAIWFGMRALTGAGEFFHNSPAVKKACEFVLSKQKADGGWGETFKSCESYEYSDNPRSQVVGTAWALLALLLAQYPDRAPILRGVRLLMQRQLPDGNWAQEDISGVFNANCAISYSGYKNIFPIWALGLASRLYPDAKL